MLQQQSMLALLAGSAALAAAATATATATEQLTTYEPNSEYPIDPVSTCHFRACFFPTGNLTFNPTHQPARDATISLKYYTHHDLGTGVAFPPGKPWPWCTSETLVGDTDHQWVQDIYTATTTTTITKKCGGCALKWSTFHGGLPRGKVWSTTIASEPFTVTKLECSSRKRKRPLKTQSFKHTGFTSYRRTSTYAHQVYPDMGPATVFPPGVPTPDCTVSTHVYGGGGGMPTIETVWTNTIVKTSRVNCGSCALAWTTKWFDGTFRWHVTATVTAKGTYTARRFECTTAPTKVPKQRGNHNKEGRQSLAETPPITTAVAATTAADFPITTVVSSETFVLKRWHDVGSTLEADEPSLEA
jgi:hypothetical protein